ncbi:hypothetical protein EOM86_02975 [Candidatus Nomurabacteria bacterium]|nr:hypothetical protein [Candidatus Nomurabacteria bacterium]
MRDEIHRFAKPKSAGVGQIIISSSMDRDEFVRSCYATGTVALRTDGNGILTGVPYHLHVENYLEFPLNADGYGSFVTYRRVAHERYVVDGVIKSPSRASAGEEYQMTLGGAFEGVVASVSVDYREGVISIASSGDASAVIIRSGTSKKAGKMQLDCYGDIGISSNNINLSASDVIKALIPKKFSMEITDAFVSEAKGEWSHKAKSYKLANSNGYTLKDLFTDIIDEVAKSTVATSIGTQPLINTLQILALKKKIDTLLS